ncbi:YeeE/YedE family protein [Massilia sp. TWP1-3-3]|uniref:YeeE/YedE family protein n=1 Tax=Massilia sp. TWP1-3-3 TaxID=2804573 RepID=UPI003CFBBCA9
MMIDWPNFTPWASLAGGALIGLAASLLILFNGRIAGISGILGGLLVGLGTRYGSGYTSGHGVCGLSRLSLRSLRSLAATLAFMGAGLATVFLVRYVIG